MPRKLMQTVADVPRLLSEWDDEENSQKGLFPDRLGAQSNKKAYWKCKYGHKWTAQINSRYRGSGCPRCAKRTKTSYPEQAVFFYVKKRFPDAKSRYREIFPNGMELDVYVPSLRIGVEYDGVAWHKDSGLDKERKKYQICKSHGIKLLRIKENREHWGMSDLADRIIHVIPNSPHYLDLAIRVVLASMGDVDPFAFLPAGSEIDLFPKPFESLNQDANLSGLFKGQSSLQKLIDSISGPKVTTDVNSRRDERFIRESYLVELGEKSFAHKHPDLKDEWDIKKNGGLTPEMFSEHSSVKVWWACKEYGHSWRAAISTRARGNGCPYCSGQLVLPGFNDLKTKRPDITAQWHPTKNGNKNPTDFTFGSGHKAWWLCPKCKQSWAAKINSRTINGRGCPYCQHEKPIVGVNDLPTLRPDLMKEWNYEKNGDKDPSSFMPSSNKKVWWKCSKCGFEYEAFIGNRNKGTGCKRCAGQILIPGVNDLATLYPKLVPEWDYEKNNGVSPTEVFAQTNKKYWWIDSYGHSWRASPNCRIRGSNCPICSGNKVLAGFNDIATTYPEIASEWHPTKNGSLLPTGVSKGCTKKIWFLCSKCGYEYQSFIGNKVKGFGKCPKCSNRKTRAKRVYLVETGQYFGTLKEAARSIGQEDIRSIQACCAGRIKQAFGLHWEYRD